MTDSTLPPLSQDEDPIDAEFEPAIRDEKSSAQATQGPGWFAFGLLCGITLLALSLAAATAGFIPGFKPGSASVAAMQSDLNAVQTTLSQDRSATNTLSTDVSALQTRADSLAADRTRTNTQMRALRTEIETLQADISMLQRARVASIADQGDSSDSNVSEETDFSPLAARVTALEDALVTQWGEYDATLERLKRQIETLEAQATSEGLNAASAANARTDAALALSAIEAAARRGRPFLSAQQKLSAAMPSNDAVAGLAPIAAKAVPTMTELRDSFPGLADQALDASAQAEGGGAGWMRTLFGDGIQVRQTGETTNRDHLNSARAALDAGNLLETIQHIRTADANIQSVFTDWLNNAEDRHQLEQTLEALRLTMIAEERP